MCIHMHVYKGILVYLHLHVHIHRYPDYQRLNAIMHTGLELVRSVCVCMYVCKCVCVYAYVLVCMGGWVVVG